MISASRANRRGAPGPAACLSAGGLCLISIRSLPPVETEHSSSFWRVWPLALLESKYITVPNRHRFPGPPGRQGVAPPVRACHYPNFCTCAIRNPMWSAKAQLLPDHGEAVTTGHTAPAEPAPRKSFAFALHMGCIVDRRTGISNGAGGNFCTQRATRIRGPRSGPMTVAVGFSPRLARRWAAPSRQRRLNPRAVRMQPSLTRRGMVLARAPWAKAQGYSHPAATRRHPARWWENLVMTSCEGGENRPPHRSISEARRADTGSGPGVPHFRCSTARR